MLVSFNGIYFVYWFFLWFDFIFNCLIVISCFGVVMENVVEDFRGIIVCNLIFVLKDYWNLIGCFVENVGVVMNVVRFGLIVGVYYKIGGWSLISIIVGNVRVCIVWNIFEFCFMDCVVNVD